MIGCVRLDGAEEIVVRRERGDRPACPRDDPDRERGGVPERRADRGDRLADLQICGVPERKRAERVGAWIDAEYPDIVEGIPPDDRRTHAVTVGELDKNGACTCRLVGGAVARDDHMGRGEHEPRARDDEAGALLDHRRVAPRPVVGEDRDNASGARGEDLLGREAVSEHRLREHHRRRGDLAGERRAHNHHLRPVHPAAPLGRDQHLPRRLRGRRGRRAERQGSGAPVSNDTRRDGSFHPSRAAVAGTCSLSAGMASTKRGAAASRGFEHQRAAHENGELVGDRQARGRCRRRLRRRGGRSARRRRAGAGNPGAVVATVEEC